MYNYPKQLCSKLQTLSSNFIKTVLVVSVLVAGTVSYVAGPLNFDSSVSAMKMIQDDKSETIMDSIVFVRPKPSGPTWGPGCCAKG